MPLLVSPRASSRVLPWCRVVRAASSSKWSSSRALNLNIRRTRSMTEVLDQVWEAAAAASTAASTSAAPDSGTCSITSPVAGLYTGREPVSGAFHSEPIRLRIKGQAEVIPYRRMAPSARELLEAAAAQGGDLESVARGVLERLAELTGLSSTYLAETRLIADEQY